MFLLKGRHSLWLAERGREAALPVSTTPLRPPPSNDGLTTDNLWTTMTTTPGEGDYSIKTSFPTDGPALHVICGEMFSSPRLSLYSSQPLPPPADSSNTDWCSPHYSVPLVRNNVWPFSIQYNLDKGVSTFSSEEEGIFSLEEIHPEPADRPTNQQRTPDTSDI